MNPLKLRYSRSGLLMLVLMGALTVTWKPSEAWAQNKNDQIGFVIATKGKVSITSKAAAPRPASLRQNVFPNDTIQTGPESATKILFDDNTLLSVTENTQIEITEYIYDPTTARRSTIFKMVRGRLKALIADFYAATNSRFEIHTPTAVAAARGTEYTVWTFVQNGLVFTGVAVSVGAVTVTNPLGQSVTVTAGLYTVASPTAPPAPPAPVSGNPQVQQQVQQGNVKTDPAVVAQVTIQMAQQAQAAQQAIAGITGAVAAVAAAPPGLQAVIIGAGGISNQMGTTNTPCTVVSPSGNLPLGCTPTGP